MYDNDDDYGCAGCLIVFIIAGIFGWIAEHWVPIVVVIGIIIAIPLIVLAVRKYKEHKAEEEAEAKKKAEQEAAEKAARERETYDRYFSVQKGANLQGKLDAANAIVRKLFAETNEDKRRKTLDFFDKYLPLITEIIEASKHGGTDADDAYKRFTETVKAFSKNLYKADDVIDANKTVLENMAIRDGLYDPYEETFTLNIDPKEESENQEVMTAESIPEPAVQETESISQTVRKKAVAQRHATVPPSEDDEELEIQERLEDAILMDDYDTIREMLDCGEIDETDLDDEVLSKVETYI